MDKTITLNGNYGYTQYRYNGGNADAIDASNATWTVSNAGANVNLYPFLVDNANTGIDVFGATVTGTIPMTGEWLKLYTNSAAVMVRDTKQADIYDLRISDAWDGLRVAGKSEGFEISNVWISDVRDDAFENDNPVSGSIRDSLFDGVFSGISLGHKNMANASQEVLELDGVLMRMESYLFKGEMTHQSPFKMESKSPKLSITDTVIAIDDVDHVGQSRLQLAWDKLIESSGNVFLNLSDKPLPSDYPMPPAGWTVLQGQAARDYWEDTRNEWTSTRGDGAETFRPAPEVVTTPEISEDVVREPLESYDASRSVETVELEEGIRIRSSGKIELDPAVFTGLQKGVLREANFEVGARAIDGNDQIIYKWKTGELFYDADGRGGESQIKIAQLESQLQLDHTDFVVAHAPSRSGETAQQRPEATPNADVFIFRDLPRDGDFDTIIGFDSGTDKFRLDSSAFASLRDLKGETLNVSNFEVAARADDMNDFIMYKWKTGELFYDPDGRGSESQIKIAQLDDRLSLDSSDFLIF